MAEDKTVKDDEKKEVEKTDVTIADEGEETEEKRTVCCPTTMGVFRG